MGEEIEVRTLCSRIGTKSFDLEHVVSADGRVVAEAKSVLVAYDYDLGASVPVPDELRRLLAGD
jgi:acyl-CoA thioester hydrolase